MEGEKTMALDYRKCAEEIAANIGGGSNVISAAHCATRLRLVIADNGKVNKAALENVDGVKGMFESNGQLQLIIGTGTVNKVYDEFLAVTGLSAATKADVKAAAASKMPWWKKILKTPGDIFVPILPAIVASGLMMGIVEAIPKFVPAFGKSDWFTFLDLVANTAFVMLPVLVAISAARVFGGNIFLGGVIGFLMIHPALIDASRPVHFITPDGEVDVQVNPSEEILRESMLETGDPELAWIAEVPYSTLEEALQ